MSLEMSLPAGVSVAEFIVFWIGKHLATSRDRFVRLRCAASGEVLCRSAYSDVTIARLLQQLLVAASVAGHSRGRRFGVMLRALHVGPRYAGRPTTSYAAGCGEVSGQRAAWFSNGAKDEDGYE